MGAPKITLYVDIVSPFAYIAFHVLKVGQMIQVNYSSKANNFSELAHLCQGRCQLCSHPAGWSDAGLWQLAPNHR